MEDLSRLLAGRVNSLVPTAQSGGGEPHDNSPALTARPVRPSLENTTTPGEVSTHPAPQVDAQAYDTSNVLPETSRKPLLKLGQWNDMRGPGHA